MNFDLDCTEQNALCNSDVTDGEWHMDGGFITDKSTLPVLGVHIGDIGESSKKVRLKLGPLVCNGSWSELADFIGK